MHQMSHPFGRFAPRDPLMNGDTPTWPCAFCGFLSVTPQSRLLCLKHLRFHPKCCFVSECTASSFLGVPIDCHKCHRCDSSPVESHLYSGANPEWPFRCTKSGRCRDQGLQCPDSRT